MKKLAHMIVEKRRFIFLLYLLAIAASLYGMINTKVNYDMSKYLPDSSQTKEGMAIMSKEFGDMSSITVMFRKLDEKRQTEIVTELEEIKNVKSVLYLQNDEGYQKDSYSRYQITVSADTYSKEASKVLDEIREKYKDEDLFISGAVCDSELLVSTLEDEIPLIALVAVVIIFAVLFLLCDSWAEPFLFMGCIGIAILLNMGTNALLPSVSFMTNAVGALLQLGLSMDYSIMLMNRYMQEKKEDPEPKGAMRRALTHSFGAITGSSVTTIAGLLVLVFMSFKIGQDMGIVLAKGVFISLLCIFTLLPGLTVKADPLICRTHKRSLNVKMGGIMKVVGKGRFILTALILIITGGALLLKGDLEISYIKMFENKDQQEIEAVFGVENQTILLYEQNEDPKQIASYIQWLEKQKNVHSVQDYSNTIGKEYTYTELSKEMGLDIEQAKLIFRLYEYQNQSSEKKTTTMYELISFAAEELAQNPIYKEFISQDQLEQLMIAKQQMDILKAQLDIVPSSGALSDELLQARVQFETKMTSQELAAAMNMEVSQVESLLQFKSMAALDVESTTITLEQFMEFMAKDIMENEIYASAITQENQKQFKDGQKQISDNKELMVGKHYNRMVITTEYPIEGNETFSHINNIQKQGEKMLSNKVYLIGDSSMGYEMDQGFSKELNFVTILTIVTILAVVLVTFRSIFGASVLVVVIQSAVYITTALVCLQGITVNYIALILVQCILMGATIDYGILLLSNYREERAEREPRLALIQAMNHSIKTILTSSLILICSCLTVGFLMSQKIIAQTCSFIAYGAICAVILVLFILPALLLLLDRFIIKRREDEKNA